MNNSIVIFGAGGQVGSALVKRLGDKAIAFDSGQANFTQPEQVATLLDNLGFTPQAVINAAAYTAVDKAEEEEKTAHLINAESPAIIAHYCAKHNIPFVHYSTDYVYAGNGDKPWTENSPVAPLNAYGRTKLAGDTLVEQAGGKYLIFRTSWVYDAHGKNFLNTMLRLGREREALKIVNDQFGTPSYAPDIAEATLKALGNISATQPFPSGIYHLCGSGITTWHGFANAIFTQARKAGIALVVKNVEGIPASSYPTPAKRPHNSRMDCNKAATVLGVTMPDWQESLAKCFEELVAA